MIVDMLVEGVTDQAVARQIIAHCGHEPGTAFGKRGIRYIQEKIDGFNVRARYGHPILALVDFMDTKLDCAPSVVRHWLPNQSDKLCFRVVMPELESWLMADRQAMARYLGLSVQSMPRQPELLEDPKRTLINLARRSKFRKRREALVPGLGLSASVGPGYTAAIEEFVIESWRVDVASLNAPSLRRCIDSLRQLNDVL